MYVIYDRDTGEDLYSINTLDEDNFQNTATEYTEKLVNGQIVEETKVRNISYRKE